MSRRLVIFACLIAALSLFAPSAAQSRGHSSHAHGKRHAHPRHRHHRHRASKAKPSGTSTLRPAPSIAAAVEVSSASTSAIPGQAPDGPSSPGDPVWADEFSGPEGAAPDSSKWNFDVGGNGWGNSELQYYRASSDNASLDGRGELVITARAESYRGADGIERHFTSARLQTLDKFEFTYGLMEARIQVPAGTGLAPAFWSLGNEAYTGDDGWPGCGEIDAMEVLGSEPNILNGTVHGPWPSYPNGIGGEAQSPVPLSAGFHTYGVQWSASQISFLLDGSAYKTITREDLAPGDAWPFQHPNFLLLNLAVGGDWPGSPDASTHFPARMLVDWVRVWH